MASSEDILLQFTAEDEISSVVQGIESVVVASMQAISDIVTVVDSGFSNLSDSSSNLSSALSSMGLEEVSSLLDGISKTSGEVSSAFDNLSSSASSLSNELGNIKADGLDDAGTKSSELATELDSASQSASQLNSALSDVPTGGLEEVGESASELSGELSSIDTGGLGEISSSSSTEAASLMYLANQFNTVGGNAENMARNINESEITLSQLAVTTGMARDELASMVNSITDVSFPHDEAMMYIKNLKQMHVESSNYAKSAKDMDTINDALGLGANVTNSLSTEMAVLGVDMNNVSSSFNALAYANANTKGGMENFYSFLKKYDAQLNEMGFDMDQTSLIISAATQKYGGGRAALTGLSTALKESGGDARALEEALGMQSGALDNASQITGEYEGQLEELAGVEASHKTLSQQLGAIWEDLSVSLYPVISPLTSFVGILGDVGGYAVGINAIKELGGSFKKFVGDGGIDSAIKKLKEFGNAKKVADTGGSVGGSVSGVGKGMSTVATNAEKTVEGAAKTGALAGPASSAGAGMKGTSVGLRSIGQGALEMVAPLIQIAIVIAILIPIIAGLVAEALIFLKGIQMLLDGLNFDSIDLSSTIESIKQIGQALLEMGIAMGEMAFANVMTGLAVLTSGVTGLINPVQVAGEMLKKAGDELAKFKDVNIDESVPDKLRRISEALRAVSSAMMSLTNVVVSMAFGNLLTLGGRLGTVTEAVSKAREEIEHASKEIAKIKDLPDIEQGAVDKLNKISQSLASVSEAMDSLRSIRDGYNWDSFVQGLFGGVDIQTALTNVKQDIIDAGSALAEYKGLPDIGEDVGNKLKKIADSLKSVGEAINVLRGLRDDWNWDSAVGALFGGVDVAGAISGARGTLIKVANQLVTLQSLPTIPDGIYTKVQRIGTSARNVATTIRGLNGLSIPDVLGMALLPTKISMARDVLINTSRELVKLQSVQQIPDGIYTKVQRVGTSARNVGIAVQGIKNVPTVGQDMSGKIRNAVTVVRNTARELTRLQGINTGGGISGVLNSVRSAVVRLRATINGMRGGFRSSGVGIGSSLKSGVKAGLSGLSGVVSSTVSTSMRSGVGPARSGGTSIGNSAKQAFHSSFKISQIASQEVSYATQAVQSGTSAFVDAVRSMASQAVQAAKDEVDQQSPGRIARMFGAEMDFSKGMIVSRGQGVINAVRSMSSQVVSSWNGGLGNDLRLGFDGAMVNGLRSMAQRSSMGKTQRPVSIHIGEGAVQLDARNMTTKESQQIMLNALEGLNVIEGINIRGV